MIKPRRMAHSDVLQVVMPASSLKHGSGLARDFAGGLKHLQKHFRAEYTGSLDANYYGFAATDRQRAKEFNDAIRSPKNGGIIAGMAGYGSLRIVNQLDSELIKQRPKAVIGLSDVTILQLAIYQQAGVITFSGPPVVAMSEYSATYLGRLLYEPTRGLDLIPEGSKEAIAVLSSGSAEGALIGGNLYSMVQLAGTGLLPRFDDSILFIEDADKTVDQIDSCLQHLKLAGALYYVAGVVIGNISWRKDQPSGGAEKSHELLRARLEGMFRKGTPIIRGIEYGHVDGSITIPIGARARLDTESRSLVLLEDVTDA